MRTSVQLAVINPAIFRWMHGRGPAEEGEACTEVEGEASTKEFKRSVLVVKDSVLVVKDSALVIHMPLQ